MVEARWSSALVLAVVLLAAGRGGSEPGSSGDAATDPDPGTSSAAPALAPEGESAREVTYRCTSGRSATVVVDVPDLADLAAQVVQPPSDSRCPEPPTWQ